MTKDLYETAKDFFTRIEGAPGAKELLEKADREIQFSPDQGEPFYVEIRAGKIGFGKGEKYGSTTSGLTITGEGEAMASLFCGKATLAETIYDHKIRIPGYRKKEPAMVWFSRLLRKGNRTGDFARD